MFENRLGGRYHTHRNAGNTQRYYDKWGMSPSLMTKQFVTDLKGGGTVESYFAVIKKESIQKYKNKSGFYFGAKLGDKTGEIDLKYWGNEDERQISQIHSSFGERDVIRVTGNVNVYQGKNQITVNHDQGNISRTGSFEPGDLLKTTSRNIEDMKGDLREIIDCMDNVHVKALLKNLFDDEDFMDRYANVPAAKSNHHNYIGGLLEHVLSMVGFAKTAAKAHQRLDCDLLVCGCILHDIGKMEELEASTSIAYTTRGSLLGHITMGYNMISQRIQKLDSFPEDLALKILHMILSHHGKLEWASPVVPKFPEAVALHHIDNLDAKVKGVIQNIENSSLEDEWSPWTKEYGALFLK